MSIFFTPDRAWLGDVIPYAENGKYYLYYLNDKRYNGRIGQETTWDLVTTTDFVHFKDEGTALPIGARDELDNCVYTGSVYKEAEGKYHIFYTAQNNVDPRFTDKNGLPMQVVVHATSSDLIHWDKHLNEVFLSTGDDYTLADWRDPFVFRDEVKNCYTMLLAAAKADGSYRRGGCTLACHSDDLIHWTVGEPLYAPDFYLTHECPDLFKMGDKWYLAFSTFTDKFLTHYRISDTPYGPWLAPMQDSWDGRAYYAAKTAETNGERYAFGWIPTRAETSDFGRYEWGGTLVAHQLIQQPDGTLYVKAPDTLCASFVHDSTPEMCMQDGPVAQDDNGIHIDATYRPSYAVFDHLPCECMIEAELEFTEGIRSFGLALHQSNNLDDGYFYKVEPFHQRFVMDMWPRRILTRNQVNLGGDIPMQSELERPFVLDEEKVVKLRALVDRDCVVVYLNDQVAMSTRIYNLLSNQKWGFFAIDGKISVRNIHVKTR